MAKDKAFGSNAMCACLLVFSLLLVGCEDPYEQCLVEELPKSQKALGLVQLQLKYEDDFAWFQRVQSFYEKGAVLGNLLKGLEEPRHNLQYPSVPEATSNNFDEEYKIFQKELSEYQIKYELWQKEVVEPILDDAARQAGFLGSEDFKNLSKELFGENGEILNPFVMARAKSAECWGGDKEEDSDDCRFPISAEKEFEQEKGLSFEGDLEATSFIANRAILETLEVAETRIEEVKLKSVRMTELTCSNTVGKQ